MVEIKYCPSTLAEGYNTYSPQAVKRLFDGKKVLPFLDFNINELKQSDVIVRAMQRISVSGVQEKFFGLIDQHGIRIAESNERFGAQIGLTDARIKRVLDKYMQVPELTTKLVGNSFLNDKMKRTYLRIVDERVKRFVRNSE